LELLRAAQAEAAAGAQVERRQPRQLDAAARFGVDRDGALTQEGGGNRPRASDGQAGIQPEPEAEEDAGRQVVRSARLDVVAAAVAGTRSRPGSVSAIGVNKLGQGSMFGSAEAWESCWRVWKYETLRRMFGKSS